MSYVRTAVVLCATLALFGCFAYVATSQLELVKLSADSVIAEETPTQAVTFPTPHGHLEKNCMDAKIYAYSVADSLGDLSSNAIGPVKSFLENLAPMPMTKENLVPTACTSQFQKWLDHTSGSAISAKVISSLEKSLKGDGILKTVTEEHGPMIELDWDELGLNVGAETSMDIPDIAVKKVDYQETQKEMAETYGSLSALHSTPINRRRKGIDLTPSDVDTLTNWKGNVARASTFTSVGK